jgi:hypothetical protein
VAWMLGTGKIDRKGALPAELCIPPADFLDELRRRGIKLSQEIW